MNNRQSLSFMNNRRFTIVIHYRRSLSFMNNRRFTTVVHTHTIEHHYSLPMMNYRHSLSSIIIVIHNRRFIFGYYYYSPNARYIIETISESLR
ncbi:MAG: hypothetical protein WC939_04030 [Acholeplasmataceae bacterium]